MPAESPAIESESRVMVTVYEAVRAAQGQSWAAAFSTAAREIGPRWRLQGLARTLAFCAAKADLAKSARLADEARANRRLLEIVLGLPENASPSDVRERVEALAGASQVSPPELEARVLWLRRYAEVLLSEAA